MCVDRGLPPPGVYEIASRGVSGGCLQSRVGSVPQMLCLSAWRLKTCVRRAPKVVSGWRPQEGLGCSTHKYAPRTHFRMPLADYAATTHEPATCRMGASF